VQCFENKNQRSVQGLLENGKSSKNGPQMTFSDASKHFHDDSSSTRLRRNFFFLCFSFDAFGELTSLSCSMAFARGFKSD
jgi:hypothetical protein